MERATEGRDHINPYFATFALSISLISTLDPNKHSIKANQDVLSPSRSPIQLSENISHTMNLFTLSAFALTILPMAITPVSAHGYVSNPPSRQALCRDVPVPNCGDVRYEPQSVEAPKGSFLCNGDGARFFPLNDDPLWANYFTTVQSGLVTFTWTLTAPHRTSTWEYFVLTADTTLVASFNDGGAIPPTTVVHEVPLAGFGGRQTILARWNIADTINAFYSCVDLDIVPSAAHGKANGTGTGTCVMDTSDAYRNDQQNVLAA